MLFNKELNNNKLIFNLVKLIRSTKTKSFKMMKIFLYIVILKRKRENYNINLEKSLIKML